MNTADQCRMVVLVVLVVEAAIILLPAAVECIEIVAGCARYRCDLAGAYGW